MTFIFLSLLELAIIGCAERRRVQEERKRKISKTLPARKKFSFVSILNGNQTKSKCTAIETIDEDLSPLFQRPRSLLFQGSDKSGKIYSPENNSRKWKNYNVTNPVEPSGDSGENSLLEFNGAKVDNAFARLCPLSFCVFCCCYWGYYIVQSSYQPEFL